MERLERRLKLRRGFHGVAVVGIWGVMIEATTVLSRAVSVDSRCFQHDAKEQASLLLSVVGVSLGLWWGCNRAVVRRRVQRVRWQCADVWSDSFGRRGGHSGVC